LGFTFPQVLATIVLPQALRTVVSPLGGLWVALVKNSSIASIIAVKDLAFVSDVLTQETARAIPIFLGTSIAYLLITIPSGVLIEALDRRMAIRR
jgi:ABC-type amino acid transport system permease subunit